MKTVIIGGVAGGASAAARLRRLDESAEIVVLERSGYVSYANCGLPYYVGGTIEDQDKLTLQSPESFRNRFNIDVRVMNEAISIDRTAKTVTVKRLTDGSTYVEPYDKLILSPGAKALRPDVPGIDDPRVMTLRTVEDALGMRDHIIDNGPRTAVVAGGGYIGLEVAENLADLGLRVTLLQRPKQVLPPVDPEMAAEIHANIRSKGIDLRLGTAAIGFQPTENGIVVALGDGGSVKADMAVIALGVVPETTLAKDAGLELGIKGSILVDDHMCTSDPDIYAVGDAIQVRQSVTGEDTLIALAGPANRQGRIAADNICGIRSTYIGSQGSSVIKVFDQTVGMTGINEKTAKAAGMDYEKVYLYSAPHATYYPGGRNMSIKVLFERGSGKVIGSQIVGYDGVDKRTDVIATAIRAGMTFDDLAELDLAYAPPYSSAKDPVNMAGFVMQNIDAGIMRQFFWDEVDSKVRDPSVTVLDTRTDHEFMRSHIDGVQHIPLDSIRERMSEIDRSKPVYIMCHSGLRSYVAYRILTQNGFDCYNLAGGYRLYSVAKDDRLVGRPEDFPCGVTKD